MDSVVPFRAWRYARTGCDLAQLVAPPYDVVGPDLQSRLYARSSHNVVRVDLGMTTPSDNDCDNRYTRAARQLEEWKESGVLVRDQAPTFTFVEEEFTGPDGRARVRRGFLAAVRLHDFCEGIIFPHERTFPGPKEDRFELMKATAMSLSPVFLLYDLPGDEITVAWSVGSGVQPPAAVIGDEEGNVTRLWPIADPALKEITSRILATARFIIADGHHRYETALRYRDYRRRGDPYRDRGDGAPPPAYEYGFAYFSNLADPGLAIYATHRLVKRVDPERLTALPRALAGTFAVDPLPLATSGAAGIRQSVESYLAGRPRGAFAVWVPATREAYGLSLVDRTAAVAATPGHAAAYRELDVTILQKLILEQALGIPSEEPASETYITFVKDTGEAFERLEEGEFQAGFFMNPTGLEQIRGVAFAGERMPHKATFFYPKLPTGLVFLDLAGLL